MEMWCQSNYESNIRTDCIHYHCEHDMGASIDCCTLKGLGNCPCTKDCSDYVDKAEVYRLGLEALKQPKIIYCKDCKHRDPEDKKCDCGHDILWQLPRKDNWYCADAKRRPK